MREFQSSKFATAAPYVVGVVITFSWKEGQTRDIGLAAEDVVQVDPLFTFRNGSCEIEGVKYDRLSAAFINAFKEQQVQIQDLERDATAQKHEVELYRRQLAGEMLRNDRQQAEITAQKAECIEAHHMRFAFRGDL